MQTNKDCKFKPAIYSTPEDHYYKSKRDRNKLKQHQKSQSKN